MVAFLAGAVFGFIFPRSSPTAKNQVEVNCPACPDLSCPEAPQHPQDPIAIQSLNEHHSLLVSCYEEVEKARHELENCRLDVVSVKSEAEDCRVRYNNQQCP